MGMTGAWSIVLTTLVGNKTDWKDQVTIAEEYSEISKEVIEMLEPYQKKVGYPPWSHQSA